ncbi:MAG: hypothetical protein K2H15_04665, partial [Muribaculaceae bacterium]|nr:hypothetical protein [Muribaculaceae bacterium]
MHTLLLKPRLYASAEGFNNGITYLSVIDNDIPALELQLSPQEVSENAGPLAVRGVITRSNNLDKKVTVWLTTESRGEIFFPVDKVTLAAGEGSAEFTVGVYDNGKVDGDRNVDVTAAVYISSCSCTAAGGRTGSLSRILRILDDDGRARTLSSNQSVVAEGDANGMTATVRRNAELDKALEVKLSCDTPGALNLPESVIIPQGSEYASFKLTAPLNDVTDDDRTVVITAESEGYSSSSLWVLVTDRTLPDARISSFSISADEAVAGEEIEVSLTLANTGLLPLPAQTCVGIYADKDQLTRLWLQEPLAPGKQQVFSRKVTLPAKTGKVSLYAVANPEGAFKEMNSGDNTSEKVSLLLVAPFRAKVEIDKKQISSGESIKVAGSLNSSLPEATEVEVYIINDGVRTIVPASTTADGTFETSYSPLVGQNGRFIVGACYPGENLKEEMASFDILALRAPENKYLTCRATAGVAYNLSVKVQNPCGVSLSDIKASLKDAPEGVALESASIKTLGEGESAELQLVFNGSRISSGNDWERLSVEINSKEGGSIEIPVYWYCFSAKGILKSSVAGIEAELPVDTTVEYPVTITNNGAGESGRIELVLPEWMKCAGPSTLPSINAGEQTTFTLLLKPTDKMNLNLKVTGRLAVNCANGEGFTIPY